MTRRYLTTDALSAGSAPAADTGRTISYHSDPIGKAFGLAIIVGVTAVPLIAITVAIVNLGDVRGMWGLLIFGVMLLVTVMFLYRTERRFSPEGIDLRKVEAIEAVELTRVEGEIEVQKMHAAAFQTQADNQRLQIEKGPIIRPAQSSPPRLGSFVAPHPAPEPMRSPWVMPEPVLPGAPAPVAPEPPQKDATINVMMQWAQDVYLRLGSDGRIYTGVPWAERGPLSTPDGKRAQDWLQRAANTQGSGWAVQYRKDARGWFLNIAAFPDALTLTTALRATPPPLTDEE